jgi:hypothetical protein
VSENRFDQYRKYFQGKPAPLQAGTQQYGRALRDNNIRARKNNINKLGDLLTQMWRKGSISIAQTVFGLENSKISSIYNDDLFLLFCLLRILWFQSKSRLDHGQHQEEDGEAGQRDR